MRRAFTIIELLIVLGIIALITSIVIKGLDRRGDPFAGITGSRQYHLYYESSAANDDHEQSNDRYS